jgi:CRISPR/Cas system Type II protein with McrA/HNH and RuvC-like nuclease domain
MRSMAPSLKCCYPGLIESHIVKHRGYLDTKLNEDDDWYYDRIVF